METVALISLAIALLIGGAFEIRKYRNRATDGGRS